MKKTSYTKELEASVRIETSRPSNPANILSKKILIIGEAGVGKSSMINVLVDKDVATVSDGAKGCTFQFKTHSYNEAAVAQESWNFIDTVGLNEAPGGTIDNKTAAKLLIDFMKRNRQGFHGIIMVMKKGRISENFERNHNLFVRTMLNRQVPCILMISHCEEDEPMDNWKYEQSNLDAIHDYCFAHVVCGTLKKGGRFESELIALRRQTRNEIFNALQENMRPIPFRLEAKLPVLKKMMNIVFEGLGIPKRFLSETYDTMLIYIQETYNLSDDEIRAIKMDIHEK